LGCGIPRCYQDLIIAEFPFSTMATESGTSHSYDPNIVIKAADEKLAANDVSGGQTLFQSALLNWVDDAQFAASNPVMDVDQMREAIATLWIAYAHYLQKAKQFKSATEAYEQAVACPIGGKIGRVWLDYARFLEERGKLRTAQQVYLRALVDNDGGQVEDEQDRNLLWSEFLEMMRTKTNKPDLTMGALKQAIEEEHHASNTASQQQPQAVGSNSDMYDDLPPASKRPRLDGSATAAIKLEAEQEDTRSHVVTASDVKTEETALMDIIQNAKNDPQFMATWMVRDGDAPPQAPETPLFEAAPPKLSDPTGKDLLGEDLALQLVRRLLEPAGSVILQISRGLWMMTALKEHQSHRTLKDLDKTVKEEAQKLRARLDERLSVAGAAEAAVRTVNETERQAFQANCNQQRKRVLNDIAWEFRELLWVQQQFLTKLNIPGFYGATVDASELEFQARVCSYLHSSFFLRQRIGEEAHIKMLKSQESRLLQLIEDRPAASSPGPPAAGPGRTKPSRFSPMQNSATAQQSPIPLGRLSPTRNSPVPAVRLSPTPAHMVAPVPYQFSQPQLHAGIPPPQIYNPQLHPPPMPQQPYPPGIIYPPQLTPQQIQIQQQQQMQQMAMMPPNYPQHQQPPRNPPYY
jgi:tetratricopeptide (TPR) repeat protein